MANTDDILQQAAERFKLVSEYDQDERQKADDDIRFASNDDDCQWPGDLKTEREEDGRPCLVINKIPEKIDQVQGEFMQLQPSFKVRAIDSQADPKVAEIYGGIMRHIEYNSDARTAYNTSHTSTLHCGRGAWRIDVVPAEDDPFVRDIRINRIPNVLTVYWDPYAKKADKSDANYIFVTELINKTEFEKDYKDVLESWPEDNMWDGWKTGENYRVAEYWWKEKAKQTYYRVKRNVNGVETELTVTEMGPLDQLVEQKDGDKVVVKWCKLVAKKIVEGPHEWATQDIPIIIELGKEINIRGVGKTRGMVRHAKEAQMLYNYWSSNVTEQVALAPKAPYLVTAGNVNKYQDIWNSAFKKNYPYLPFDVDPNAPGFSPRREPPPQLSSAYQYEFMRLEHDIMSAMGIYAASLGDVDSKEQSGRAIMARQRQGNIGSFPYTDSFNIAYTYSCKQIIRLIPKVYDTERIVRIVGQDGQEDMVPVNARGNIPEFQHVPERMKAAPKDFGGWYNDLTVGKYDIAVTVGPSYTTQREETFTILMDMVKTAPMLGQAIMDLVAANLDIPKHSEELVKRLRKLVPIGIRELEPGEQPPENKPDPKVMLEMAKLQLEKEMKEREMGRKEFEAQMKAIADLTTAEAKEVGAQVQAMTAFVEQLRTHMDMQHNQLMQIGQMGHQMNMDQQGMDLQERQHQMQQQQINAEAAQNLAPEPPKALGEE